MLQHCLERLLTESAKIPDLQSSIQDALESLEMHKKTVVDDGGDPEKIQADRYWEPFQVALHPSRSVKIREVALDCVQKLIAHHRLKGAIPGTLDGISSSQQDTLTTVMGRKFSLSNLLTSAPTTAPISPMSPLLLEKDPSLGESMLQNTFLIDQIIHSISNCFTLQRNPTSDKENSVQLQVLKLFLTAVTSGDCEIHEISLVKLFETCFSIHITSPKGSTNEVTSKAILTQMVNVIFSRMERHAELHMSSILTDGSTIVNGAQESSISQTDQPPKSSSTLQDSSYSPNHHEVSATDEEQASAEDVDSHEEQEDPQTHPPTQSAEQNNTSLASEFNLSSSELSLSPESQYDNTNAEHTSGASNGGLKLTEGLSISTTNIAENEEENIYVPPDFAENNPYKATPQFYHALLQRDVFLVFRFLCYMSVFSDSETRSAAAVTTPNHPTPTDDLSPASIKARALALELVLSVLNNAGPILRSNEMFVVVVREKLCMAISKNALTTEPTLFELSLSIFLLIIRHYRDKLKVEVEVLLNTIFLHILEMGNSTYKQKSIVLQGLIKICENPQTLVDLYVNYDCDMAMTSVFERLANICARITQKRSDSSNSSFGLVGYAVGLESKNELLKEQDRRLKLRGLCALVAIIQSLVSWSQDDSFKHTVLKDKANDQLSPIKSASQRPDSAIEDRISESSSRNELGAFEDSQVVIVNKNHLNAVTMMSKTSDRSRNISSSPSPGTDLDAGDIQNVVSRKQQLKKGIKQFNRKPNKGIKDLISNKLLESTPEAVADFLQNTTELSKSSIGEYLGDGDQFNIKVMHAFIDNMDFSGMGFVDALRTFLQAFRLPGEAQKIDRIMEKFADRFCENNPEVFAKADTAYTLAFSVIMLNTDQHSAQIKHRMDKAAFIKNNRGINDDGDLPDEFLSDIFDDIAGNEIIMEEEHAGKLAEITKGWGAGDLNDRQRMEFYRKEVSMIQKKSQMLMAAGQANRDVAPYRTAIGNELARPMFAMIAWPLMATLSLFFEAASDEGDEDLALSGKDQFKKTSSEPRTADLCLKGFAGAIRLASVFRMETERDAFVTSLAKLTGLGNIFNLKPKNMKGIRTLVELAGSLGEYMETSWIQILKAMSQIERLQMIVSNFEMDSKGLSEPNNWKDGHPKVTPSMEQYAADFSSQSFVVISDRIFTTTGSLSSQAILHFFRCLCQVSLEEVGMESTGALLSAQQGPPRMYSLQKIVEVAHYNVKRIRYEWTQIWRILQTHFNIIACHPDQRVATFAVDSLRQLGMKFLEREELGHFSSQHEFLKSFESIIRKTQSRQTRELILSSVSQMISAKASSIRSGWRSLFVVLVRAAQTDEKLAKQAFSVVQMIFRKHIEDVVTAAAFVDFVSSLAEFALLKGDGPVHDELVMGSIQLLQSCTKSLIDRGEQEAKKITAPVSETDKPPRPSHISGSALSSLAHPPRINNLPTQPYLLPNGRVSEEHFYLTWFPILSAFSRVIIESDGVLVRTHTLETLFETLRSSGSFFEPTYWKGIHRNVLAPIFEDLSEQESQPQGKEASSTILILGLRLLVDMVTAHFDDLVTIGVEQTDPYAVEFLQSSLDMMVAMMGKKDEKLPLSGQLCLNQFLLRNVEKLSKLNSWEWLVDKIYNAFAITSPLELINCDVASAKPGPVQSNDQSLTEQQRSPSVSVTSIPSETVNNGTYEGTIDESRRNSGSGLPPISTLKLDSRPRDSDSSLHGRNSSASGDRRQSVPQVIPIQEILTFARKLAHEKGTAVTLDQLDFDHTVMKCATHLELIRTIRQFCLTPVINDRGEQVSVIAVIPDAERCKILHCMYNSYSVARAFNALNDLRRAIKNKGWISRQPNLFKQEALSFASYIALLFAVYKHYGDILPSEPIFEKAAGGIPQILIQESIDLLDRFTEFLSDMSAHAREIEMWYPVVILIYRELLSIQSWWSSPESAADLDQSPNILEKGGLVRDPNHPDMTHHILRRELPRYFRRAIRLMNIPRQDVRNVLQEFMERVGSDIFKAGE